MPTYRLRYRTWFKGLPPRPTRLEVPGWSGADARPADGATPQPRHCQPFAEAAAYGLELRYPFDTECRVRTVEGMAVFDGDFHGESPWQRSGRAEVPPPGLVVRLERLDEAVARASHVATNRWQDAAGRRFDNRYKVLRKIFADGGWRAVLRAVRGGEPAP